MFIIFCTIRPKNNVVYAPRLKYSEEKSRPQALSKHPFAWVKNVFKTKEDEYLEKAGLDAVVYIRFTAMCRNIFAILSLFAVCVILPINVLYNRRSPSIGTLSMNDAFILTTPILISGNITAAHVTLAYIFDFIVLYFLWANYDHIIRLRRKLFMSEEYQNALFMRTLLLIEVPKKYKVNDQGLMALMDTVSIQRPIQNATVGRLVGELQMLTDEYNHTVLKLESVLAKYLKDPDHLPQNRPVMRPFKGDKAFVARSGKIDSISYLTARMQRLEAEIFEARDAIDTRKTLPYGFVSYESVEDCNIVAKAISERRFNKNGLRATLAPRPEDIIWENIVLSRVSRRNKQYWGNFLFFLLMVIYVVPNAFLGAFLSQLSRIGVLWPPFNRFIYGYPVLFSIVQGVLAPVVTSLIFLMMPAIMRKMSHWQGKVTKHDREMDVTRKLYAFFVFNNVFVFTVFSVVWSIVVQIINLVQSRKDLSFSEVLDEISVAYKLSTAIMSASSFWVMYILRVNFGAVLDLLQLVPLLYRGFQRHFLAPTPRQQMLWTAPQHFNFAAYYNWMLFYSTIAFCFAMIQPLVLVVVTLYFSLDIIYKKYGLMYIFVTKAETDGLFWPLLFNSFLFAMVFGNFVLFVVVWVQGGWRIAAGMAPLLLIVIAFKIASNRRHKPLFRFFIPTEQEKVSMDSVRTRTDLSDTSSTALARRFRNPVIDCKLMVPMVHAKSQHLLSRIADLNSFGEDIDPESAFRNFEDDDIELENIDISYDHARSAGFGNDQFESGVQLMGNKSIPVGGQAKQIVRRKLPGQVRASFMGRFNIVRDDEMNYEHLKLLEESQPQVPDELNPYLNTPSPAKFHADTSNDAAIASALDNPIDAYSSNGSYGSSDTFVERPDIALHGYGYANDSGQRSGARRSLNVSQNDLQAPYSIYPVDSIPNLRGQPSIESFSGGMGAYGGDDDNRLLLSQTQTHASRFEYPQGYPDYQQGYNGNSSQSYMNYNNYSNQSNDNLLNYDGSRRNVSGSSSSSYPQQQQQQDQYLSPNQQYSQYRQPSGSYRNNGR